MKVYSWKRKFSLGKSQSIEQCNVTTLCYNKFSTETSCKFQINKSNPWRLMESDTPIYFSMTLIESKSSLIQSLNDIIEEAKEDLANNEQDYEEMSIVENMMKTHRLDTRIMNEMNYFKESRNYVYMK